MQQKIWTSLKLVGLFILCCTVLTVSSHDGRASAADARNFNAGRIIDDSVFTNDDSMSVQAIQSFLDSKVTCDTWGAKTSELGGGTRAQWMSSKGITPPFKCADDYFENPSTGENNYSKNSIPAGAISAAQIIYNYAKQFHINPQVLIVTLQKENGLITDEWPTPKQYSEAMGFGCPDNVAPGAPACDPNFGSFSAQIYEAARHFRGYIDNKPGWWIPYNTGPNTIYFNPGPYNNSANQWYGRFGTSRDIAYCGSTVVDIQNRATVALYSYTPYQPNQSAKNAQYGSGDICGAYGNRNFYLYFTDWFGPTLGPDYISEFHSQNAHISMFAGETKTIWFKFKNAGRVAWGDDVSSPGNPIHLATNNTINRNSAFGGSWPNLNRPNLTFSKVYESDGTTLAANQHVVNVGQVAMFEVTINAPSTTTPGEYKEDFAPIREGAADWWVGPNVWTSITVAPTYKATFSSQSTYPTLKENDSADLFNAFKNSGNAPWYDDISVPVGKLPVHLATTNPINTASEFGWAWANRSRPSLTFSKVYEADGVTLATDQHVVAPGQIGRFDYTITGMVGVPTGSYKLSVQPIVEGATNWDMGAQAWLGINYVAGVQQAQYYSQSTWPTVGRGNTTGVSFQYKNTGTVRWRDDLANIKGIMPLHLASTGPINRVSLFANGSWVNNNRPSVTFTKVYESDGTTLSANQHIVEPGQIARFDFTISVPGTVSPGQYNEHFQPILEGAPGLRWVIDGVVFTRVTTF